MEEIMIKQVSVLREQMISTNTLLVPEAADEQSMPGMFGPMGMRFGRIQG
ncbi:MAG: hypothetical protein ACJ8BW_33045 [Ktedonobacteraceae bacterium]